MVLIKIINRIISDKVQGQMELIKRKIVTVGGSHGITIPPKKIKKRTEIIIYITSIDEQKELERGGRSL